MQLLKEIIDKNGYKIRQIIKNFTGEYNEDLEQEVYIRTYLNLDKYKERNKFSQWICTIAANLCRDYLKSAGFKNKNKTTLDDDLLARQKANDNPSELYNRKERQKIILKAINSLPFKMKQVIILYEFEDYSYEEIAKKLKVPQGTVKSRLNNARKMLAKCLNFLMEEND